MEEMLKYTLFVIIMAVVIIAVLYFGYAENVLESQKLSGDELIFKTLCGKWRMRNCTLEALEDINYEQTDYYEEKSLTDLCTQFHDQEDVDRTITTCRDICFNKCNSKLWYDVGISSYDIRAIYATELTITVHNYGTGTIYDFNASVYDVTNNEEWIKNITIDEIGPKASVTDVFAIDESQTIFFVKLYGVDDADDSNNEATKNVKAPMT